MSGATPLFLSAAFILEEGTDLTDGRRGRRATGRGGPARPAYAIVTGDTKVVESGHGDGVYVNTAGIGLVPDGVDIRPDRAAVGRRRHRQRRHRRARRRDHERPRGPASSAPRSSSDCAAAARPGRGDARGRHGPARAARPDPRRRGHLAQRDRRGVRTSASRSTSGRCPSPRWSRTPAPSSAWTRCRSPTRASCSRSSPPERRRRGARGDARPPARRRRRRHRRVRRRRTPAWSSATTGFGATRVVDLPIGEQLPRIC